MKDFLSIEETVKLTKTSESTVRRWIRSLTEEQRKEIIKKEGKRLYILTKALQEPFDLLPGIDDTKGVDLITFQRQQLQEGAKLTAKMTEQNERLFSELTKANDDLKTAWSLIDSLKAEVFRLTSEIKRLESPEVPEGQNSAIHYVAIVLCLVVISVMLFVLF